MEEKTTPVLSQLREMQIGDELIFPIERMTSIKSMMYTYGVMWCKKFSGAACRNGRTFTVRRIA